ncbi:MAG: UDP-N-acetylmuramoyl-L-alanyl-D-glutamate--2,6-diaminopimelate ligase [Colwellia sp.]|nr:UDP-N-acetylmuramoyl-L-alanyl-D-glutamate--2,6-diaminopimelate ligase [Colwellia sp.]
MPKPALLCITQVLLQFDINLSKELNLPDFQGQGDLTNDSRQIKSGDIFCAIIGKAQDGRQYINNAIERGASLIISECEQQAEHGNICTVSTDCIDTAGTIDVDKKQVPMVSFYQLNSQLFELANTYQAAKNQAPQTQMTMIGVTGTNGKTSTSQLLAQLLSRSGKPCAIIGTNGAGIIDIEKESRLTELANTTPSATDLVQLFTTFIDQGASHLVMEVSSHALEQKRVSSDVFDIAIFTNLSRDHLDYHGSMTEYAAEKRKLFTHNHNQIAVLNADDLQVQAWLKNWPTPTELWLYGRNEQVSKHQQFVSCHSIKHHDEGVDFTLNSHLGEISINSPLLGDFNIDNLLAVISALLIEKLPLNIIAEHIKSLKAIKGRMESFSAQADLANTPVAVVDYAHTPDALEKALIACRQHCHGKLFVVFGCGGDRDKGKRALMAEVAEKHADHLVVTNDNPRTETPMSIINDVLAGLTKQANVSVIENRKQAVLTTLRKAKKGDLVLLAGKGHEDTIILGQQKIAYNERQIVMDFFDSLQVSQTGELA